ncbi:MAG: hypothetical protein LV480_00025 [Methylacidiphilales bacterium]|nr:hypothetical protein [Candidatus Methylacidiphilales bacterium]
MRALHTVTAIIEVGAGLALVSVPSKAVELLLGAPLDSPAAGMLGRVAGAALLTLGVACWLARADAQSEAARGLVAALVLYNIAVAALLAYAGIALGLAGVALWPAVILHTAMTVWCVACLGCRPSAKPIETRN